MAQSHCQDLLAGYQGAICSVFSQVDPIMKHNLWWGDCVLPVDALNEPVGLVFAPSSGGQTECSSSRS